MPHLVWPLVPGLLPSTGPHCLSCLATGSWSAALHRSSLLILSGHWVLVCCPPQVLIAYLVWPFVPGLLPSTGPHCLSCLATCSWSAALHRSSLLILSGHRIAPWPNGKVSTSTAGDPRMESGSLQASHASDWKIPYHLWPQRTLRQTSRYTGCIAGK